GIERSSDQRRVRQHLLEQDLCRRWRSPHHGSRQLYIRGGRDDNGRQYDHQWCRQDDYLHIRHPDLRDRARHHQQWANPGIGQPRDERFYYRRRRKYLQHYDQLHRGSATGSTQSISQTVSNAQAAIQNGIQSMQNYVDWVNKGVMGSFGISAGSG